VLNKFTFCLPLRVSNANAINIKSPVSTHARWFFHVNIHLSSHSSSLSHTPRSNWMWRYWRSQSRISSAYSHIL